LDYPGRRDDSRHGFVHPYSAICMTEFKDFIRTKWATAGLALLLLMVSVGLSKMLRQKYEVNREIKKLQTRADEIQKENEELTELIKYYNTPEYTERAARDKLNLKKEGEFVVSLPPAEEPKDGSAKQDNLSNPQKWFNYFFRNE